MAVLFSTSLMCMLSRELYINYALSSGSLADYINMIPSCSVLFLVEAHSHCVYLALTFISP